VIFIFRNRLARKRKEDQMNRKLFMSASMVLIPMIFAACGDPAPQNGTSSSTSGNEGGSGGGQAGMGGAGGNAGGSGGMGGGSNGAVPASGMELFPWLQAGNYMGFTAESAQHASTGPHGGNVRTFVNPILFDALSSGSTDFPIGASAVKELWGNGSKLLGWAVFVKTQAASAGGSGFYWYENYSTTDPSSPVADGNGVGLCTGCHSNGTDFFKSPFPLQ
jgi:hypothetical protein